MNAQVRKVLDTFPSYMVAEWSLPALINGDYMGIIPMDAPESCGEVAMVAQFDEEIVCGSLERGCICSNLYGLRVYLHFHR